MNAISREVLEINRARCACGSILGAHENVTLRCPNPADSGPLFLETKFKAVPIISGGEYFRFLHPGAQEEPDYD
jgi:hypothetical protein